MRAHSSNISTWSCSGLGTRTGKASALAFGFWVSNLPIRKWDRASGPCQISLISPPKPFMISPFGSVTSKLDRFNPDVGSGLAAAAAGGALIKPSKVVFWRTVRLF